MADASVSPSLGTRRKSPLLPLKIPHTTALRTPLLRQARGNWLACLQKSLRRLHQMRAVVHLSVDCDDSGPRALDEGFDDLTRERDVVRARCKAPVDAFDLIGMDRDPAQEAPAAGQTAIALERFEIAEIRVQRVDRLHLRRRGRQQRPGAGVHVSRRQRTVLFAVVDRPQRRGEVLGAPGDSDESGRALAVARQVQRSLRGFGGDHDDLDRPGLQAGPNLEHVQIVSQPDHVFRAIGLGQDDAVQAFSHDRHEVEQRIRGTEGIDAHEALPVALAARGEQVLSSHLARQRAAFGRHRVFQVEDERVGSNVGRLQQLALAVGWNKQQGTQRHGCGVLSISAWRKQTQTSSPRWLKPWWRKVTTPCPGRESLGRFSTTVVTARRVSPANTGWGNRTSVMPRFATVVPRVVSCTDNPITSPRVNMLLKRGRPNSVWRQYSAST